MVKVHGVSLHFFDAGVNSDKFYRAFSWKDDQNEWHVAYHWGRDGAPNGQVKTLMYSSRSAVEEALEKKVEEKIRKGYEFLGQGEIEVNDISDVAETGHRLHARVGRTPQKLSGGGFALIIQEEPDLLELLT
jgi:predicted DNA-binding WGR domain protein